MHTRSYFLALILSALQILAVPAQDSRETTQENPLAQRADRLATLANRAKFWHDPEEAASLYEQAVALAPSQSELLADLAETYRLLGKLDAALLPYESSLGAPEQNTGQGLDPRLLADMAAQYKALGKLDQFETKIREILGGALDGTNATSVQAGIAIAEHRFDAASTLLTEVFQERKDQSTFDLLLELGEYQGDLPSAFQRLRAIAPLDGFGELYTFAEQLLAAGDAKTAIELWRECAETIGALGTQFGIGGLCEYGYISEAEAFYEAYRPEFEELDETALEMYQQGTGFETVAERLLQGISKTHLQSLSRPHYWGSVPYFNERYRATALRLLELDPAREKLIELVLGIYDMCREPLAAATYAKQLYEIDPKNNYYRRAHADGLCLANREGEAFALYDAALADGFDRETAHSALLFYLYRGHLDKVHELRERAENELGRDELAEFDDMVAHYGVRLGKAEDYAALLKARFEPFLLDGYFEKYLWFLDESGNSREACKYFLDPGHADRSAGVMRARTRIPDAIVHYGNFEDVLSLVDKMRGPNNADTYRRRLAHVVRSLRDLGYSRQFLDSMWKNEAAEDHPYPVFFDFLADEFLKCGDVPSALALTERLLEDSPKRLDLLEKKVDVLLRMGRGEEAVALYQEFAPGLGLAGESERALELAEVYFKAGQDTMALAEIEALAAWNKHGETAADISALLVEEGFYADAIPHLERALTQRVPDQDDLINLVRCYAELGDVEAAMRACNAHRLRWESKWLAANLERPAFRPVAAEIYGNLLALEPHRIEYWNGLFGVLLASGNAAGADAVFKGALDTLPAERSDEIIQGFGRCIAEFGDLAARLDAPPEGYPAMLQALAAGYACLPQALQTRALWVKVAALSLDDAAFAIFVERTYPGPPRGAAEPDRRALSREEVTRVRKLDGVLQLAITDLSRGVEGRIPALAYLVPEPIETDITAWELAIEHGEPELVTEALASIRERRPDSDAVAFCDKLEAFRGEGEGDTSELRDFAERAVLELWHWRVLGNLFHRAGDTEGEILVLERIADAGYDAGVRDRALAALCEAHARAGDADRAFGRFLELSPSYSGREMCFGVVAEHATAEDLPEIEAIVNRMNAEWPGNLTVPEAFGRLTELAERLGVPFDFSEKLAADMNDVQRQDARLWPVLFEGWAVSPAIDPADADAFMAEETMTETLDGEGAPLDASGWTHLEPAETLGMIEAGRALYGGVDRAGNAGGYPLSSIRLEKPQDTYYESPPPGGMGAFAYTAIESDNGGPVELTIASNRTGTQVWLNGERVYTTVEQQQVRPGQARFRTELKPGTNHVVLKSRVDIRGWYFCLGPVEPGGRLDETGALLRHDSKNYNQLAERNTRY